MADSNFVDYVKLFLASGDGGAGSTHLHREKYIAKGGPDGGNGGKETVQQNICHNHNVKSLEILYVH